MMGENRQPRYEYVSPLEDELWWAVEFEKDPTAEEAGVDYLQPELEVRWS